MFLPSGLVIKSGNISNLESNSQVSTEESIQQFGGLEIVFKNVKNSSADSTSKMASHSTNPFVDNTKNIGQTAHSSHLRAKDFKMSLTYLCSNALGAKIYGDPLGRNCVNIEDRLIEF